MESSVSESKSSERLVFSENKWVSVEIPEEVHTESWYYATLWVEALRRNIPNPQKVAEAAVFKRMYPGIKFVKSLEDDIRKLYD